MDRVLPRSLRRSPVGEVLIEGFSTEVVGDILATLALGKATGEDLVANELLRSGGNEMAALLACHKSGVGAWFAMSTRRGRLRSAPTAGRLDVVLCWQGLWACFAFASPSCLVPRSGYSVWRVSRQVARVCQPLRTSLYREMQSPRIVSCHRLS